jgi:hypothetical protein
MGPVQLRVVRRSVAAIPSAIRTATGETGPTPVDTATSSGVGGVSPKPWICTCGTPRGPSNAAHRWWKTDSGLWALSASPPRTSRWTVARARTDPGTARQRRNASSSQVASDRGCGTATHNASGADRSTRYTPHRRLLVSAISDNATAKRRPVATSTAAVVVNPNGASSTAPPSTSPASSRARPAPTASRSPAVGSV